VSAIKRKLKRFVLLEDRFPRHNNPLAGLYFTLKNQFYQIDGCSFEYPKHLVTLGFRSRFYFRNYEREEREFVTRFIEKNDRVLELGACLGIVSCLTNKCLGDPSKHVVVEANPELIPTLQRNRDRNACKFSVEHCMLSEGHSADFYIHDLIVGGSADRKTPRKTQIVCRSFQELQEKHGEFTALVIDIEGGEHQLFEDYLPQMEKVRTIILEQHDFIIGPEKIEQLRNALTEHGFQQTALSGQSEVWQRSEDLTSI